MSSRGERVLIVVAISIALAVSAAAFFVRWLQRYRPELRDGERYGVDVSHHQGPIDWRLVEADGISFAYIKATEGTTFEDPRFETNWAEAGRVGLDRGAYHFFSLCSPARLQARLFLEVMPRQSELAPALDLELSPSCDRRPGQEEVKRLITAFVALVETRVGSPVVLYIGDDFEDAYPVVRSIDRPRWRLRFILRPSEEDWAIWQVGSVANVDGVIGPVGLDVMQPEL